MLEPAQHIGRILSGGDASAYREHMLHFDNQVVKDQQVSAEKKQDLIKQLITKVTEANGAIETGNNQNGMSFSEHEKRGSEMSRSEIRS